jgi:hypothetical protein
MYKVLNVKHLRFEAIRVLKQNFKTFSIHKCLIIMLLGGVLRAVSGTRVREPRDFASF